MNVYIMIGLPGSGKSSIAKTIKKENDNTYILEKDKLREMFYGDYFFNPEDEDMINGILRMILKHLILRGKNIIIDETHITQKRRKDIVNYIRVIDSSAKINYIWCAEMEKNLENRKNDLRGVSVSVWENVIAKMKEEFEPVTTKELMDLEINEIDTLIEISEWEK